MHAAAGKTAKASIITSDVLGVVALLMIFMERVQHRMAGAVEELKERAELTERRLALEQGIAQSYENVAAIDRASVRSGPEQPPR